MVRSEAGKYLEEKFGKLTFARALRADRMSEELTQEELAEKVGVTKQAISKFEAGNDFPSAETVKLLAKVLRMDFGLYVSLIIQDFAMKKGFGEISVKAIDGIPVKAKSSKKETTGNTGPQRRKKAKTA